jgi:hypothetical protein
MDIYTATAEFSLPVEGKLVTVGMVVARFSGRIATLVGGLEYANAALHSWVGSANSLLYLVFGGTIPDPTGDLVKAGSVPVAPGSDFATVAGAAFGFIPSSVVVTVIKPSAPGNNLFATVRANSITADGFVADLSAPAGAGYVLAYVVSA